jgi:dihydroorotate dehydrogenase electron transfer subunit
MIYQRLVQVASREEIADNIYTLRCRSREIAASAGPGQFVNLRCGDACLPLLRRPFSISRVVGDEIELVFNVIGQGTRMLASKRPGEALDVLGPLGTPFRFEGDYETALIVAGGLGVAPFPFLSAELLKRGKKIATFVGARTATHLATAHLENVRTATDDGSTGFHGTVVQLLVDYLRAHRMRRTKIFGCGPTNMLKALTSAANDAKIDCELSLEGDMACGIGLCQGCPVERRDGSKKYSLVCVEGPTFNANEIVLP